MIKGRGADLKVIHEALSIATLAAIALHALSLLGDSYFHPTIVDLTIPFASGYREPYMALGIIAGWGLFLFGLSFYARKRIGIARWKVIHRFTALAWMLGVIHTLGEGSDAGRTWFLAHRHGGGRTDARAGARPRRPAAGAQPGGWRRGRAHGAQLIGSPAVSSRPGASLCAGEPDGPSPSCEALASTAPTPRLSSTCGISHEARNAIAAIGVAIVNTVWIDCE